LFFVQLYKINEVNSHKFYKIPKQLIENVCYRVKLTSDAKLVYSVLLDRMELSRKNNWVNENNEIYLLYTKNDIADILGISESTAYKAFKLLDEVGLIKQVRQGLNKPNKIFIGKINPVFTGNCKICRSRTVKCNGQNMQDLQGIYTHVSETHVSETHNVYNVGVVKKHNTKSYGLFNKLIKNPINKDTDKFEEQCVKYFFHQYRSMMGEDHPSMKDEQIKNALDVIGINFSSGEVVMEVIKDYFSTEMDCDYNLNHFVSGEIIDMRMYNTGNY